MSEKIRSPRNCSELGPALRKITKIILSNQNICKLLYYTDKDPLGNKDIECTNELYGDLVKIVPKLMPEETAHSYIVPVIVNGIKNKRNGEFRDFLIKIYVYVPMDQWVIKGDNLRPFAILGELQKILCDKYITGLGTLDGGDFNLNLFTGSMTCYTIDFYLTNYD